MQIVVDALESRQRAAAEVHSLRDMKAEAAVRLEEKLQEIAAVEMQRGALTATEIQPRAIEAPPRARAPPPRVQAHELGDGTSAAVEALRATAAAAVYSTAAAALAWLPEADDEARRSAGLRQAAQAAQAAQAEQAEQAAERQAAERQAAERQAEQAAAELARLQSVLDEKRRESRHAEVRGVQGVLETQQLRAELRADLRGLLTREQEAAARLAASRDAAAGKAVDEAEGAARRAHEERGARERADALRACRDASQALASAPALPLIAWPPPSPPAAVLAAVVRQRTAARWAPDSPTSSPVALAPAARRPMPLLLGPPRPPPLRLKPPPCWSYKNTVASAAAADRSAGGGVAGGAQERQAASRNAAGSRPKSATRSTVPRGAKAVARAAVLAGRGRTQQAGNALGATKRTLQAESAVATQHAVALEAERRLSAQRQHLAVAHAPAATAPTSIACALEAERRLSRCGEPPLSGRIGNVPASAARGSPPPLETPPHRVAALRERAEALRDGLAVASPSTPKSTGRTHECDGADSATSGERPTLQHQPRCAWSSNMKPRAL